MMPDKLHKLQHILKHNTDLFITSTWKQIVQMDTHWRQQKWGVELDVQKYAFSNGVLNK